MHLIYIYSWKLNILLSVLKAVLHNIFYGNGDHFFSEFFDEYKVQKKCILFETEILCNILNISTVTFTTVMHLFTNI